MGQFRPSLQPRRRVPADLALFSVGFLISSVVSFALLATWVGSALSQALSRPMRLAILLTIALTLLGIDLHRRSQGLQCSLGPRRQTPRPLGYSPLGPLLWGLDTGLPLTTYRTTPLPLLGLALVTLGFGHPWIGFAYALGFLGSLTLACAWPKSQTMRQQETQDPNHQGALPIMKALADRTHLAWTTSLLVTSGLALLLAAQVLTLP